MHIVRILPCMKHIIIVRTGTNLKSFPLSFMQLLFLSGDNFYFGYKILFNIKKETNQNIYKTNQTNGEKNRNASSYF